MNCSIKLFLAFWVINILCVYSPTFFLRSDEVLTPTDSSVKDENNSETPVASTGDDLSANLDSNDISTNPTDSDTIHDDSSPSSDETLDQAEDSNSISETLSAEEKEKLQASAESFSFQAEVSRLMDIIVNSLYTQKEIFLRELISNAADALEKARFLSVSNPGYLGDNTDLEIRIQVDPEKKTIVVQDTGVGMTREELINNLGTVARSGTSNFLEAIAESGDVNLIGQFGVGFYSAFLVADRVSVVSKSNNDPDQHIWESMIGGTFTVGKDPRGDTLGRGTRITLHLKDDSTQFLHESTLKNIVKKYNQFVSFPIKIRQTKQDATSDKKTSETPSKTQWEILNVQKPLWMRPKENITDEEYIQFYKEFTREGSPAAYTHFTAEGDVEFKALLFVPSFPPYDVYSNYFSAKQEAIKIYSRRVLIADSVYELLPKWLGFIRGIVDSDDLPLKVDREGFSQLKVVEVIRKKIVAKFLDLMKKLSADDREEWNNYRINITKIKPKEETTENEKYPAVPITKFSRIWRQFGKNIKIGCVEDASSRKRIAKILRFRSLNKENYDLITLDEYIEEMKENQKYIYYIASETFESGLNSPHIKLYKKKGINVLIVTEPLDEPCFERLKVYEDKKILSIEKVGDTVNDDIDKLYQKRVKKAFEPLTKTWSKYLETTIRSVRITHRLLEDPAAVTIDEDGSSAYSNRIARTQLFGNNPSQPDSSWLNRHLELNPNHPLIKKMLDIIKTNPHDPIINETARIVHDAALVGSGFVVDDPTVMSRKFFELLQKHMGVDEKEEITDYQLTEEELQYTPEDDTKETKDNKSEEIPLDGLGDMSGEGLNTSDDPDSLGDDLDANLKDSSSSILDDLDSSKLTPEMEQKLNEQLAQINEEIQAKSSENQDTEKEEKADLEKDEL